MRYSAKLLFAYRPIPESPDEPRTVEWRVVTLTAESPEAAYEAAVSYGEEAQWGEVMFGRFTAYEFHGVAQLIDLCEAFPEEVWWEHGDEVLTPKRLSELIPEKSATIAFRGSPKAAAEEG